jgi:hypothetical protein
MVVGLLALDPLVTPCLLCRDLTNSFFAFTSYRTNVLRGKKRRQRGKPVIALHEPLFSSPYSRVQLVFIIACCGCEKSTSIADCPPSQLSLFRPWITRDPTLPEREGMPPSPSRLSGSGFQASGRPLAAVVPESLSHHTPARQSLSSGYRPDF